MEVLSKPYRAYPAEGSIVRDWDEATAFALLNGHLGYYGNPYVRGHHRQNG